MLAIWSLVPMPFLNPACTSGSPSLPTWKCWWTPQASYRPFPRTPYKEPKQTSPLTLTYGKGPVALHQCFCSDIFLMCFNTVVWRVNSKPISYLYPVIQCHHSCFYKNSETVCGWTWPGRGEGDSKQKGLHSECHYGPRCARQKPSNLPLPASTMPFSLKWDLRRRWGLRK